MLKLSVLSLSLSLVACAVDTPDQATESQPVSARVCPAGVPASIAPAADQDLAFALDASGTQRYLCSSGAWKFIAPDAQLFQDPSGILGHHYAGPTWEYNDGSTVVAAKAAAYSADPSAIPWLLLKAVSHGGPDGKMTDITSIQRLVTTGGNAPAGGCTAANEGTETDVPYTATYFFYRTSTDNESHNVRCGG